MADKTQSSQSTWQENQAKQTGSLEEHWVHKAAEANAKVAKASVNVAAKTSRQAQADKASKTAATSVLMGITVIDCETGTATRTASPRLVPVYNVKGALWVWAKYSSFPL